ncbi:carbohydrate ABC transporter permease [Cohnella boryungensis]|uniref:Carbohydrate ABC transporter permease n=1 Tax=Cohnella boryungensis TaxID=768479 RepID=A0ABV8S667_9BACL
MNTAARVSSYTVVAFFLAVILVPLFVLGTVSLQNSAGTINPLRLPETYFWSNYPKAIEVGNLVKYFSNSVSVLVMTLSVTLVCSIMAGYALRHGRAWKSDWFFSYFLVGMILPGFAGTIQSFLLLRELSLLNSHLGLAIIQVAGGMALPIFLYLQFFKTVPLEIEEAATIDGCSPVRIFWQVVVPLTLPVTSTCIIIIAINSWNDFFGPLVYLSSPASRTLPIGLMFFKTQYSANWPQLFAASVFVAMPITLLYMFVQRFIIKGLVGGAVKG